MATYARDATKRFQFEANSGTLEYSQKYNCGPTCIAFIAGYYKNSWYGIEATRKLVTGPGTPTNAWQQRDMLIKRGVSAQVLSIDSLASLHAIVDSGRRPILMGIQMSRVPASVRDHSFTGWHAVTIMSGGYNNGVRGFWVNDPNFSPPGGIRPDPDRGLKWYSDSVMQYAVIANTQRFAVVPNAAKPLPATLKGRGYVKTPAAGNVINIRRSASLSATIYARAHSDGYTRRASDNKVLWKNSSLYIITSMNSSWVNVRTGSGLNLAISRPLFQVTVYP